MDQNEEYIKSVRSIKKNILHKGELSRKPSEGSVCTVYFDGVEGSIGSSDYLKSSCCTITIGYGNDVVDRVIEVCLQTMSLSETSVFNLTFSSSTLELKVRLECSLFKPYVFQMTDLEKMSMSRLYKEQGVYLYNEKRIAQSFNKFSKALQFLLVIETMYPSKSSLDEVDDGCDLNGIEDLRVMVYNNLAMCQLHFNNFGYVINLCSKSLSIKANVKAYYRRALSFISMQEYEKAEMDLLNLLKMEEKNLLAIEKLKLVRKLDETNRENYKATVRKMFT